MIITSFLLPCINNFQVFQYVLVLCFFFFSLPFPELVSLKAYFSFGRNNKSVVDARLLPPIHISITTLNRYAVAPVLLRISPLSYHSFLHNCLNVFKRHLEQHCFLCNGLIHLSIVDKIAQLSTLFLLKEFSH